MTIRRTQGCPRGVMVKVVDCGIVVSEFVLQSRCLAFVPDGRSKPRADSGPNRPPASAGQPSGGRAALLSPLYGTRPSV